ncbi:MAG: hypothetical protein ABIG61_07540 [Planctomycetota bacterium]
MTAVEVSEKICRVCKIQKPLEAFARDKKNRDGRRTLCKDCANVSRRASNAAVIEPIIPTERAAPASQLRKGISSFGQIGSAIREMAEMQAGIDAEQMKFEEQITGAKKYFEDKIAPMVLHKKQLTIMIKSFLDWQGEGLKQMNLVLEFGSVLIDENGLDIKLDSELARQRYDKP